ncbi:MAG: hypothetical protein MZV70_37675 [Desulfobacterales bacterium]|nr:hypothetical protein [Desulfobacterales bacterium]
MGADVNRFLDPGSGEVMKAINGFIAGYRLAPETYAETLQAAGFLADAVPGVPGVQAGAGRVHHRADQPGDHPLHRRRGDQDPGCARGHRRALPEPDRGRLRRSSAA